MKVVSVEEFVKGAETALYTILPKRKENDNTISDEVGTLSLKLSNDNFALCFNTIKRSSDYRWTAVMPFGSSIGGLAGLETDDIFKSAEFLEGKSDVKSIDYEPAASSERDWNDVDKVLVMEDHDVENLLRMLLNAFPVHANRVINKLNNGE